MSGFIISNSGGGAPSGVAGGDLSGSYPNPGVAKIAGIAVTGTPAIGNIIIATSTTAASWQASSSGFTAGGDLSGTSSSQTVIAIDGYSLPNPGNHIGILHSSGSALTWSAVNLAGSDITGTLAVGNQASQTLGGDLSGTTASGTVIKLQGNPVQSGTNTVTQDGYVLTWVNASTQYQAKPAASGFTAGGDLSGTSSSQNVIKIQGNAVISGANSATQDGYTFQWVNGSSQYQVVKYAGDVTGKPNASTVVSLTGSSGTIPVASTGNVITWAAATTAPGILQTAAASDVATTNITITPQAPFASASTNKTGGNLVIALSVPVSGTVESGMVLKRGAATCITMGPTQGSGSTSSAIWGPLAASATNYALWADTAGNSVFNASATGFISINGAATAAWNTNGVQLFSSTVAFAGGQKVLGISNATTNPTTNPAGGCVLYSELTTGNLKNRGSLGAITTVAVPGSNLTINSQKQIVDGYIGTCETVSSATPTVIMNYPTITATGGYLTLTTVSRATTTGAGIAVGDTSSSVYILAFKNVGGTATTSTAGISLLSGSNMTTAAAMTSPVLTTAIVGNVIQILVTNQALCTTDSQCVANVVVC